VAIKTIKVLKRLEDVVCLLRELIRRTGETKIKIGLNAKLKPKYTPERKRRLVVRSERSARSAGIVSSCPQSALSNTSAGESSRSKTEVARESRQIRPSSRATTTNLKRRPKEIVSLLEIQEIADIAKIGNGR